MRLIPLSDMRCRLHFIVVSCSICFFFVFFFLLLHLFFFILLLFVVLLFRVVDVFVVLFFTFLKIAVCECFSIFLENKLSFLTWRRKEWTNGSVQTVHTRLFLRFWSVFLSLPFFCCWLFWFQMIQKFSKWWKPGETRMLCKIISINVHQGVPIGYY